MTIEDTKRKLDRPTVRALAERNSAELRVIANEGGNVYQRSLDQLDEVHVIAAEMADDEAADFLHMYSEELNACTQKMNDDASKILLEADANNRSSEAAAGVIGTIILIIFLFVILR